MTTDLVYGALNVIHVLDTRTVRLSVEGSDPRPVPYSRPGLTYRPDVLVLTYSREDGQPWVADLPEIFGPTLKKDGTDAANRTTRERLWRTDSRPKWVTDAIAAHFPTE